MAKLAPLIHPVLMIVNETGGLSELLEKILKYSFKKFYIGKETPTFNDHTILFHERFNDLKEFINAATENNTTFEKFLQKVDFKDSGEFELGQLREGIRIIFCKFFVVQSDLEEDFSGLIMKSIFPKKPYCQLTIDELRWRLVRY